MLFFDRLQTETAPAREQLFSAPIIPKAKTGHNPTGLYIHFLNPA